MCGIFSTLNYDNKSIIESSFVKGKNRGPENSSLEYLVKLSLGFHRLAINGLDEISNQPIKINDIILICNGEIFNYKALFDLLNITPTTNSDCEIIIHLFIEYGIEQTLNMLDGEFAFILLDNRVTNGVQDCKLYVARDPFGIRSLYMLSPLSLNPVPLNDKNNNTFAFASELKCLTDIYDTNHQELQVEQFTPGTFSTFVLEFKSITNWTFVSNKPYYLPVSTTLCVLPIQDKETILKNISAYLCAAVEKRLITSERPIACLLSGGLDSSLIAALTSNYFKGIDENYQLETYSIGLTGSTDLAYAKIVAEYIGSKHTEIVVTEEEMVESIEAVIYAIESYDTTSVRASLGNYLIGKYISRHSEAKVILNGDGSDELCGGYIYMNKCPNSCEFDKEVRRLLKNIHYFDVLRSDKCISSHGLEPRTPFLDKHFVDYYLSIPLTLRNHKIEYKMEKYLLRSSFHYDVFQNYKNEPLLPDCILWRKKEAFSDGVSSKTNSLFQILQTHIENKTSKSHPIRYEAPIEMEKAYYKQIFNARFPNCLNTIPYYWMPKYTSTTDPSARTIESYDEVQ
uniref:asparagine synthase (glutamine-hydrolyzing) n=1 Tax=viral metagenome TaxID=1070528 RepID=A0A6C0LKL8_9ZZZZ